MDFIRISKKHSFWSSVAHILLNILLAITVWFSVYIFKTPWVGLVLVLVSKWRTFAVRPRFWLANVRSNLVDLIFSISIVVLMYSTGIEHIVSQVFLMVFYALWLTILKPRSDETSMKSQSLLSVFFGFSALLSVTYGWPELVIVFVAFLIGYSALRHILSIRSTPNIEILSLFWAVIIAEIAWFLNYWVIGYQIKIADSFNFVIPQAAIIFTAIHFAGFEVFTPNKKGKTRTVSDIMPEVIFSVLLVLTLLLFFSNMPSTK